MSNVITLKMALEQGTTPSQLRILANGLDRIARDGYPHVEWSNDAPTFCREQPYDRKACEENAFALRRLAAALTIYLRKAVL